MLTSDVTYIDDIRTIKSWSLLDWKAITAYYTVMYLGDTGDNTAIGANCRINISH